MEVKPCSPARLDMDGEQLRGLTEIYSMEAFLGSQPLKERSLLPNVCREMRGFFEGSMCFKVCFFLKMVRS